MTIVVRQLMMRWYGCIVWLAVCFWGCTQGQPVQRAVPPLVVLEQRLPEARAAVSDTAAGEPDSAVAGISVRRLPTLRESMERVATEQSALRESVEAIQQEIQRLGMLVAELSELGRSVLEPKAREPSSPTKTVRKSRTARSGERTRRVQPAEATQTGKAATAQQASPAAVAEPSGEAVAAYARALQLIARREYTEAWNALEGVLKQARDPILLSNARYWRGDIAFRQGNYAQAIAELQAVVENPTAPKAAAAHALLAESYLKQGEREKARQVLQTLVQRFPTSEFAPRARKLLQQL